MERVSMEKTKVIKCFMNFDRTGKEFWKLAKSNFLMYTKKIDNIDTSIKGILQMSQIIGVKSWLKGTGDNTGGAGIRFSFVENSRSDTLTEECEIRICKIWTVCCWWCFLTITAEYPYPS